MRLSSNLGVKFAVAIAVVIVIGLGVNILTPAFQASDTLFPQVNPPSSIISFEDVVVERTTTAAARAMTKSALDVMGGDFVAESALLTRMEIFSAQMSVEVEDVESAITQVASIARQMDGYVAASSASIFGDQEVATITIRVPRDKFYPAIGAVELLGEMKDKATQNDDVTEEFIDLTARRDNLQNQEERLHEILDLANSVEEVLTVERELERVRGEVERLTGRINYLENNVALSTIAIAFAQPVETPLPELDWTEPFKTGIAFLYATFRGLVLFASAAVPFAVIGAPAYFVYKYRKNRQTPTEDIPQRSA